MAGAPLIDLRGLTKRFGSLTAVESLDLAVGPGEIYGLLGPDGAGKSTTIRSLMGFINPTGGHAGLLGGTAHDLRVRGRVGYVGGDVVLDRGLKVRSLLTWYADLRGGVEWKKIDGLCEQLSLDPARKIGELSTGNRQKVAIVQAFMHDPGVLVLDEPTVGLDPLLQRSVLQLVRERRQAGAGAGSCARTRSPTSGTSPGSVSMCVSPPTFRSGCSTTSRASPPPRSTAAPRTSWSTAAWPPWSSEWAGYGVDRIVSHGEDLEDVFFGYYQEPDGADRGAPPAPRPSGPRACAPASCCASC